MAQMTMNQFDKFIDNIYDKVMYSSRYSCFRIDNKTIVFNCYNNKSGIARCCDGDKFNIKYGVTLAYCRMKGIEFPKVKTIKHVSLNTLHSGDKFTFIGDDNFTHKDIYIFLLKHPYKDIYYIAKEKTDFAFAISPTEVSIEIIE